MTLRLVTPSKAAPNTLDLASVIAGTPQGDFHSDRYLRHTARRLEHLATLGLDLSDKTVLEVGAGIGDLTTFFLDRGCRVHATEGRPDNLEILEQRYADATACTVASLDLDPPPPHDGRTYDVVFSYGLLYHLSNPAAALDYLASSTAGVLLLETIVKPLGTETENQWSEDAQLAGSAVSGTGSRPHRAWVWKQLHARFPHVYLPRTQPSHIEFPVDWTHGSHPAATRSVFIASRTPIETPSLTTELLMRQTRA